MHVELAPRRKAEAVRSLGIPVDATVAELGSVILWVNIEGEHKNVQNGRSPLPLM